MTTIQLHRHPFRYLVGLYGVLALIFAGLFLLSASSSHPLSFLDAWFLSASAISVTGLSTIVIAEDLSRFGQWLLLIEMQIGGIGIMVIVALFLHMFMQNVSVSQQTLMSVDQNQNGVKSVKRLWLIIFLYTLLIESMGVALFFPIFHSTFPTQDAFFQSVFHTVASFTNAGFDVIGGDLSLYQTHQTVLLITAALIIAGAIGFPTVMELLVNRNKKYSLTTKINLRGHLTLLFVGCVGVFLLERNGAFQSLLPFDAMTNAFFLSAASRNGGLSSIDLQTLTSSSLLLIMVLMFIGGSASSAAGGIRITTVWVLGAKLISIIRGTEEVVIGKKSVYPADVNKALLVVSSFIGLYLLSLFTLSMVETVPIQALAFEIMSAMTTTGFSIGITAQLHAFSLYWLAGLMIIGRIGVVVMLFALVRPKKANTRYVKEHVMVG